MLNSKPGLLKSQQVVDKLAQQDGMQIKKHYVCQVLRHDIGARYKRVRKVPFLGNTARCLLLR